MKTFIVHVEQDWTEPGEVEIQANNKDQARELAKKLVDDESNSIRWDGSSMDPGDRRVGSAKQKKRPAKAAKPQIAKSQIEGWIKVIQRQGEQLRRSRM
jgi:hypothetical protein